MGSLYIVSAFYADAPLRALRTPADIADHAELLRWFDHEYNEVRPHQSLGYLTPGEYYRTIQPESGSAAQT